MAVIFIATTLSFFLVHLAPGDPFSSSLESLATDPRVLAARRAAYGLDRPLAEQYVRFLTRLVTGDLGPSILAAGPAEDALAAAIPNTLVLMGTALALGLIAGVALGAWQAMRVGSRADRAVDTASLVVASLPEFWLGLLLLLLLAGKFRLFPTGGAIDYSTGSSASLRGCAGLAFRAPANGLDSAPATLLQPLPTRANNGSVCRSSNSE